MTINIFHYELKEEDVQSWCEYAGMFTGLPLTPTIFKEIVENHEDGKALMESVDEAWFETGEREWFMEMLSEHLIGERWPTYGDDVDGEEFMSKIIEAWNESYGS